jgi:hypothetical protein
MNGKFYFFSFHFGDDANDFWVFMPHANIDETTLSVLNGNQADSGVSISSWYVLV